LPKKFEIHLFGEIRGTIKAKQPNFEAEAETLEESLYRLWKVFSSDVKSTLFNKKGILKPCFLLMVNSKEMKFSWNLKLRLKDKDCSKIPPSLDVG